MNHKHECQDIINHVQTGIDSLHISYHLLRDMNFGVRPGNQAPEQWVKVSNIAGTEENKTIIEKIKVMLIIFFDVKSIVLSEFLPYGSTINQQVY